MTAGVVNLRRVERVSHTVAAEKKKKRGSAERSRTPYVPPTAAERFSEGAGSGAPGGAQVVREARRSIHAT